MKPQSIRADWEELRRRLNVEAIGRKMSQEAVLRLSKAYEALSQDEQCVVNALLGEWVVGEDESKRFDALALIREHAIGSAIPSIRTLVTKLEVSPSPGAPYELKKAKGVIEQLTGSLSLGDVPNEIGNNRDHTE
jgi:hypothetical protein